MLAAPQPIRAPDEATLMAVLGEEAGASADGKEARRTFAQGGRERRRLLREAEEKAVRL